MEILVIAGILLGFFALAALSAIWKGYVLSILWGWFVVPLGVPALSITLAIGMSLVVGLLTGRPRKKEDEPEAGWAWFMAFIVPAIALLIGWIVTKFM